VDREISPMAASEQLVILRLNVYTLHQRIYNISPEHLEASRTTLEPRLQLALELLEPPSTPHGSN
jgi:hypothetical protein